MKISIPVFIFVSFFSMHLSAQTHPFEVQGHRGCRGLRPENSLPAFHHAIQLGVKTLELDVVISQDNQVVVSHEPYFHPDISTDPSGKPVTQPISTYHLPYAEIKKYDVGLRGNPKFPEQIPTATYKPLLSEVLAQTRASGVAYNIELKSLTNEIGKSQPDVPTFCRLVAEVWRASGLDNRLLTIQSFDENILQFWYHGRQTGILPTAQLAWLIEPDEPNDLDWEKLGMLPDIWSPHFSHVTTERINQCHQKGIRVIPWTVNQPVDMIRMKNLGCDGLITDYPDRAKGLGLF